MKTLYLTDLDGTLLNNNASLSDNSIEILNRLLSENVFFTVATARTYATVIPIFEKVDLKYPLVLMNGVWIYDPVKRKTLLSHSIDIDSGHKMLEVYSSFNITPMLYFEKDSHITVEYIKLYNKAQTDYVNSRKSFYNKAFVKVDNFSLTDKSNLIYSVYLDSREKVEPIYNKLLSINGLCCNFYPDNYTGFYFLEVFAAGVSKLSGAMQVKNMLGCDKIVAFGDNINDLPLLEAADEGYAVENASDEVKKRAGGVIGKNSEDAVAAFLEKRFNDGLINS
ncbi:MAG: HAD family hydrolase [Acutalibacteraceae bacterium]